jgi:hypothetical protein
MGACEGDTNAQKNLAFSKNKENFPHSMGTENVTFITVPYPSAGEKTVPASSPPGDGCRDIPPEKNDHVDYPGRSVLYSRQFRPLNRILGTDTKKPRSGEP